jgi:integrase
MSIRRIGRRWQVRVSMGGGERLEQTLPPGATRRDAEDLEATLRRARINAQVGRKQAYLIDDALDRWVETAAKHLKSWPRDLRYRVDIVRSHTARKPLTRLPDVAEAIKAAGLASGLKPPTINRCVAILRRIGRLAERWGWTDEPLGRRVEMLPENSRRDVYLSEAQVRRLVAKADALTGDMIWFAALTGLRRGEMLELQPDQVRGSLLLLGSNTKTGRPRAIPMPPLAARIARRRLPWGVAYWQVRKRFDAARKAAGLRHVHFHDLRHTYASWLIGAGHSLFTISKLLGHSSTAVTERYAHLADQHLEAAVKSLPGWERTGKKSVPGRSRKAA